jgi:excisionase family DNA binding protein
MQHAVAAPSAPLTVAQVAQRLGISRMQVYRLISSGRLTAYNYGDGHNQASWHVKQTDLEAFDHACCNNPQK